MKLQRIIISIISLVLLNAFALNAQDRISESECVSQLTAEVDPPFRLKRATAIKRCSAIAARINTLSKQILGKWQSVGSKGRRDRLEFFADGTVRGSYSGAWAIVNPYVTLGSEVIQFNDEYLREIKFSGTTMTIISTPTSSYNSYSERYKRIK